MEYARRKRRSTDGGRGRRLSTTEHEHKLSHKEESDLTYKFGKEFLKHIPQGHHVVKKIGEGSFGVALLTANGPFERLVVKLQVVQDVCQFQHEVEMGRKFAAAGLAPKILDVKQWTHRGKHIAAIVMNKIDGILEDLLKHKQSDQVLNQILFWVVDSMKRMCAAKLTHGDMHAGNIGFTLEIDIADASADEKDDTEYVPKDDEETDTIELRGSRFVLKPTLIDFGWSTAGQCNPELELIQFLRTSSRRYNDKMPSSNENYLQSNLYQMYHNNYNKKLRNSQNAFEDEWGKLMDKQAGKADIQSRSECRRRRRSTGKKPQRRRRKT
jgi:hypothetical protein